MQSMFARTCEPLVLGPAFAMDRMPGPVWVSLKFCKAHGVPFASLIGVSILQKTT